MEWVSFCYHKLVHPAVREQILRKCRYRNEERGEGTVRKKGREPPRPSVRFDQDLSPTSEGRWTGGPEYRRTGGGGGGPVFIYGSLPCSVGHGPGPRPRREESRSSSEPKCNLRVENY